IRDWSVTGVQTCALPILDSPESKPPADGLDQRPGRARGRREALSSSAQLENLAGTPGARKVDQPTPPRARRLQRVDPDPRSCLRSEERRVGKECGSGWGP